MHKFGLSVFLSVSNERQNFWTDRTHFFVTSHINPGKGFERLNLKHFAFEKCPFSKIYIYIYQCISKNPQNMEKEIFFFGWFKIDNFHFFSRKSDSDEFDNILKVWRGPELLEIRSTAPLSVFIVYLTWSMISGEVSSKRVKLAIIPFWN